MAPERMFTMANKRRKYTREFKLDAVRMVIEQNRPVSEVAENLGINPGVLQRWRKKFEEDSSVAFPGHGKLKPEDEEIRRLRKELSDTRQERDILKKAMAYFVKDRK
jgi:transposase